MAKKNKNKVDRRIFKKEGEELQQYLHFRKRGSVVENKKGKGAYNRQKSKRVGDDE
jgi:stalled ribosome alternative rescue factor ArfA